MAFSAHSAMTVRRFSFNQLGGLRGQLAWVIDIIG
jgi:hypothetical protein